MKKVVFLWVLTVLLSSCGEYNKILKSTDYQLKYSYAKKYFNAKQYSKSATLLDELVQIFKGTADAEESLYLLAQSYYGQKDYQTAQNILGNVVVLNLILGIVFGVIALVFLDPILYFFVFGFARSAVRPKANL